MLPFDLSVDDLRRACLGAWLALPANPEAPAPNLCTDTRALKPGDLFVALRGDNFDGHAFLADALAAGAAGLLVERGSAIPPIPLGEAFAIEAENTLAAYGGIAAALRRAADSTLRVAAIVGSSGKTTTKDLLAGILRAQAGASRVVATEGNFNNLVGAPKTLLGLRDDTLFAVLEAGMNEPGELSRLARIIHPDVSVGLNIGTAHRGRFASAEAHVRAKREWFESLPSGRRVLINADGQRAKEMADASAHLDVQWFGANHAESIAWVRNVKPRSPIGYSFELVLPTGAFAVELPLFGAYSVGNALAAAAAAWTLGVDGETIARALYCAKPGKMRGEAREIAGRRFLVDCYNAAPEAMVASINSCADAAGGARRVAMLGDMLELGALSRDVHRAAGEAVAAAGFDAMLAIGEASRDAVEAAAGLGVNAFHCRDHADAARALADLTRAGDLVLLKGSRGMAMEKILPEFERFAAAAAKRA